MTKMLVQTSKTVAKQEVNKQMPNKFHLLMNEEEEENLEDRTSSNMQNIVSQSNKMKQNRPTKKDKSTRLQAIKTFEPESLNMCSKYGKWELLQVAIDSGATESVLPDQTLTSVLTTQSVGSRRGVEEEWPTGSECQT